MARIASTAVALPEHRITQRDAREACARYFRDRPHLTALMEIFDRAGVGDRYLSFPVSYYFEDRPFSKRNADFVDQAVRLGGRAVREALDRARVRPSEVDQFYFTTTTGLATPSVDALLAADLGFRPDCQRNPLFGIGCAGGAAMLGRAAQALQGRAVLLSVELCGQTFRPSDASPVNLVGAALFGDGAAAAVVDPGDGGPRIAAWDAELFPGTRDAMGWDFVDDGFRLILSKSVPSIVVEKVAPAVRRMLESWGVRVEDIRHWALHPGGARVLEAWERAFGIDVKWSRESLRRHGNLSSAAVLFILDDILRSGAPKSGDRGLVAAVGPGFALEAALLEW
ncbi:MAG TPA: 3-oxoacyl-[acyl-carrier-protein] synthase III C-terminal domain-containing protein [Planctomycetota bacterium]|nr:3-oxoacyl-[acyl-carrier-protein] synthase III C-terminal domain-containing protein [Planctomycetota bacterium]